MTGKELVQQKHGALITQEQAALPFSVVTYENQDDSFCFTKTIDGDRFIEWKETEQEYQDSKFVGAQFESEISDPKRPYYMVAAASGLLTATLSTLRLSDLLKLKDKLEDQDIEKYVVYAAKAAGYKKSDYKGAAKYISRIAFQYIYSNVPSSTKEYLRDLSSSSKIIGLVFSIIAQFTRKKYRIDDKGELKYRNVPKYYVIGDTPAEKIFYGFLYWVFALAADSAISQKSVVYELKFAKELLEILENILDTPLMSKMPADVEEAEKEFSLWLEKWFENSTIMEVDGTSMAFNLVQMIKAISVEAIEESASVLLNECLFRGFYFLKRLSLEMKTKNVSSFDELSLIDPHDILPFNNQIVSKMAVIASGVFVAADLGCATLRALLKTRKQDNRRFLRALLAEANIAGIGRFILAVGADSKYWLEDFRVLFVRKNKRSESEVEELLGKDSKGNAIYSELTLNFAQARLLYCLESDAISNDIRNTETESKKAAKKLWLKEWQDQIVAALKYSGNDFFTSNESELNQLMRKQLTIPSDRKWLHLLAMEFALFEAYYPLGTKNDSVYSKLKYDKKHSTDSFLSRQHYVLGEEWKNIQSQYKKHYGIISGNTKKVLIGASVSTAVIFATGGLASVFAPEIAVAIAGGSFVGLHGIALTNASLALIGGGALAVGGGGMAAGAAIITGGGLLLGAAGSGSVSLIAMMAQADPGIWAQQGSKLATYSSAILNETYHAYAEIAEILSKTSEGIFSVEKMIKTIKQDQTELDKELLKLLNQYQRYLERTEKQIRKNLN